MIAIGLPTPPQVDVGFALANFPNIVKNAKKDGYKVCHSYKIGVRTDSNRNSLLKDFLNIPEVTHILWLDVDMLYPPNIVDLLVKADKDVIGTVYYKRSYPYNPCVYIKNDKKVNPYTSIDTHGKEAKPLKVDGVGYGGLMIKREVYEALGDNKWTVYDDNFHNPVATTKKLSHDLKFCQTLQENGYDIYVHNGCVANHLSKVAIGYKQFIESNK